MTSFLEGSEAYDRAIKNPTFKYLDIARRIPVGTRNIDRMREDVHCTVMTVLGLVTKRRVDRFSKDAEGYRWYVYCDANALFQVECSNERGSIRERVYSAETGKAIPIIHVEKVYSTLGRFIEFMCETFPGLEEVLQPLIHASWVNQELFQ